MNPWYDLRDFITTALVKMWRRIRGGHWVKKVRADKPKRPHSCSLPGDDGWPPKGALPGSVWQCHCGATWEIHPRLGGSIWMRMRRP